MENGDLSKLITASTADRTKKVQGLWKVPNGSHQGLRLFNSFTRQKELFVPENGKKVLWYTCGPTVYDASHMGHARAYISFDILRRVLTDYFNYDVAYAMNITDIDDKIIKRARIHHLLDSYKNAGHSREKIISDFNDALSEYSAVVAKENDESKKTALAAITQKGAEFLSSFVTSAANSPCSKTYEAFCEPMGNYLDKRHGRDVTDNAIFSALPRYWENEFFSDMEALHVLSADILTRVSEYVPEIVQFIQNIISNGYAYEAEGSVYFDTVRFDQAGGHHYAKLVPEAFGNTEALAEGEGDLSQQSHGKRQAMDFALWKASKPGEPAWDSPWGRGRPGWHIECSVMATEVLGNKLDIHAGGIDLRFPHHDNEIAQSEACFESDNWVNYFLHSGHLTIEGCKMSKSLKNFITIKDALKTHTARQIRIAFLLNTWIGTLDYSASLVEGAVTFEKTLSEFFLNIKDLLRTSAALGHPKWTKEDLALRDRYLALKQAIHEALCDSVDTKSTMLSIREIISATNIYLKERVHNSRIPHPYLIRQIGEYITRIMRIFGVVDSDSAIGFSVGDRSNDVEATILPYVNALAEFREKIRKEAQTLKATNLLKLCDEIRDDILPNLGVRLEDREGQLPAIKLVDRDELLREREMKIKVEEEKRKEKERKKQELEQQRLAKEKLLRTPASELFRFQIDKFSKFNANGMPTHDAEGKEVSKGLLKKLQKQYDTHKAKYDEHLTNGHAVENGDSGTGDT